MNSYRRSQPITMPGVNQKKIANVNETVNGDNETYDDSQARSKPSE